MFQLQAAEAESARLERECAELREKLAASAVQVSSFEANAERASEKYEKVEKELEETQHQKSQIQSEAAQLRRQVGELTSFMKKAETLMKGMSKRTESSKNLLAKSGSARFGNAAGNLSQFLNKGRVSSSSRNLTETEDRMLGAVMTPEEAGGTDKKQPEQEISGDEIAAAEAAAADLTQMSQMLALAQDFKRKKSMKLQKAAQAVTKARRMTRQHGGAADMGALQVRRALTSPPLILYYSIFYRRFSTALAQALRAQHEAKLAQQAAEKEKEKGNDTDTDDEGPSRNSTPRSRAESPRSRTESPSATLPDKQANASSADAADDDEEALSPASRRKRFSAVAEDEENEDDEEDGRRKSIKGTATETSASNSAQAEGSSGCSTNTSEDPSNNPSVDYIASGGPIKTLENADIDNKADVNATGVEAPATTTTSTLAPSENASSGHRVS
jgi:hypothetical protein